jgi:hypothetical protein
MRWKKLIRYEHTRDLKEKKHTTSFSSDFSGSTEIGSASLLPLTLVGMVLKPFSSLCFKFPHPPLPFGFGNLGFTPIWGCAHQNPQNVDLPCRKANILGGFSVAGI